MDYIVKSHNASESKDSDSHSFRIDLSYVGHSFFGFQSQVGGNTVQDHLEKALLVLLQEPIKVQGASRTDSGVHAHHQVACFKTSANFSESWIKGLNALTPPTIGIQSICQVESGFNPIKMAKAKTYRYRLWQGPCYNPFTEDFVWAVNAGFDFGILQQEAQQFIGLHDFKAFCNTDTSAKTSHRKINDILCEKKGPLIDVWIQGEGFLKQMVRIMLGTLVVIAQGKLPIGTITELLEKQQDRTLAGMTAPARGLSLIAIYFDDIKTLEEERKASLAGYCLPLGF